MNDRDHFDVIVAGVGAMGSAALDHLAGRGARVLGVDPREPPHGEGSSGGDTRLIRKAYYEHPDYVPLLERAYANWRSLEADTGQSLLIPTGIVYVAPPDAELLTGSMASAEAHGLALEPLDGAALTRHCPGLRRPPGYEALFEPDAGFLLCERAVAAQLNRARARGGKLVTGERVLGWRRDGAGLSVTTTRSRYRSDALVLTLGSWSPALLAELGIALKVTRQLLFWLPSPGSAFDLGSSCCWAVQRPDRPGLFYGFPELESGMGRAGVKIAHHAEGEPADPDAPRRAPADAELSALLESVAPFAPDLAGPASASHVCLYTNSADGHFVIDRHPDEPAVVFGCGFSGHGFKFASVVGEVLADLALEGATPLPAAFLRRRD